MDPLRYCRDKAAPPGSSLHYALLFANERTRPGLLALNALHREITDIVPECSEPDVARIKLQWWREEIERIFAGEPRHPVSRALAPSVAAGGLEKTLFEELVSGAEMDLAYGSYPSFRELTVYCHRIGGSTAMLAVRLCGANGPAAARAAHDLGMAYPLVRSLRRLGSDVAAGRIYLPEDELADAGVDPSRLLDAEPPAGLDAVIAGHAERAAAFLASARGHLREAADPALTPIDVHAALYQRLLTVIEGDGHRLRRTRSHLTPIRKLFIAWRAARRLNARPRGSE